MLVARLALSDGKQKSIYPNMEIVPFNDTACPFEQTHSLGRRPNRL